MAQHVRVVLVDDLDGSEASDTVSFGLDGQQYEMDLSDANAAQLREALAPFVAAARRSSGGRRRSAAPRSRRPVADRDQSAAVREWARQNGHKVSGRGRIPNAVVRAFEERDAAAEPVAEAPKKRKPVLKIADPFNPEQEAS
ncbi:histone-like nucleoid-structuring protein Lsr2 [Pseudonocardia bannensis]|uniref:Lsr2 family protein n=1 Tax=Pseudonocardia bannensis TaxID=630973 RepID=A0A848DPE7_9PSEU|nr:Lsr2 family protein [Pseudonocardia bannensis]NMH94697.1 Lsr2 family protein [Pseudonocardia bannensis]